LAERVAWYEQIVLLRKIHVLEFDTTRHPEAEVIHQRRAEAIGLLSELALVESNGSTSVSSENPVGAGHAT